MNDARRNPIRTGLAAGIATLMLTLSVVVPVLERDTLLDHPVAEQQHAPGECPSAHDHTICTQVSANLAVHAAIVDAPVDGGVTAVAILRGSRAHAARAATGTRRSRAPPLV